LKFAVLGGSFNPVHNGHIKLAEAALEAGYDRVIFVPVRQSPFKGRSQQNNAEDRLEMLLASLCGRRAFTVDACEIKRQGVSYTIDTISDIKERYTPEGKPGLIFGDDICRDFSKWERAAELAALADINIARRNPGAAPFPFAHKLLNNERYTASSSGIRAMIAQGGEWESFVPKGAARIIKARGFYGCASATEPEAAGGGSQATPGVSDIENTVRGMMNIYRFIHSRNTALHSTDLARRFGLSEDSAFIAGITHDMCKEFSVEEIRRLAQKDGLPLSPLEEERPSLLHGRAAAVLIRSLFNIRDPDIIEAIRFHTLPCKAGMGPLAKIIYLTDKIEVGRMTVDNKLRELAFGPAALTNLDELYTIIHKATIEYLKAAGKTVVE